MTENIVTSEQVSPKKSKTTKPAVKKEVPKNVDKIIVYFESGSGYILPDGFKFTKENRMRELPAEMAHRLLSLDNFRLPSDEEKEVYYNSQEA